MRDEEVEPVDLEPLDVGDQRPPPRPLHISRGWIVAVVIAAVAWGGIAFATRRHGTAARPAANGSEIVPPAPPPPQPAAHITDQLPIDFALRMGFLEPGHWAISTGDELFVIDRQRAYHVELPPGVVGIEAQSGDSVLVRVNGDAAIVTTSYPPIIHAVPNDSYAIPAVEPGHWWYVHRDGVVLKDGKDGTLIPSNLSLFAAVDGGFVAVDNVARDYVIWDGRTTRPLLPLSNTALIGTTPDEIVFTRGCSAVGCRLVVLDPFGQTRLSVRSRYVFRNATISPSRNRIALITTDGTVVALDARTGRTLATTSSIGPLAAGMPLTWTREPELLVVQHFSLALISDGTVETPIGMEGIQQVVPLP